jgi:peptidoglycan/LPS O-acetylase OafA/YrhL
MILLGFLVFGLGVLFLYLENDRIGFALGITGFTSALLGVIGGNWIAANSVEIRGHRTAHKVAVVGFCIAVVGIVLDEFLAKVGAFVMIGGLCTMFFGFLLAVRSINQKNSEKQR